MQCITIQIIHAIDASYELCFLSFAFFTNYWFKVSQFHPFLQHNNHTIIAICIANTAVLSETFKNLLLNTGLEILALGHI